MFCRRVGDATQTICTTWSNVVCDAMAAVTQLICDAMATVTRTICDATQTVSRTVCDATRTVTQTICDAVSWIPIIGDLICTASHIVSTVICTASHVVSDVICVASHVVSTLVCISMRIVTSSVCILWRLVTAVICVIVGTIGRLICLLVECGLAFFTTGNEVSEGRSECIYGWTAAYRVDEDPKCRLRVTLRIRLVPDTGVSATNIATVQGVWEPGIEQAWSDRFGLLRQRGDCECTRETLGVDVQWVTSGEHHTVTVHAGSGRADMLNWFVNSSAGTAAHEAGHMFGNIDEYADTQCPSRTVTSDGSIMQNSQTGSVKSRHYQGFADWLTRRSCCTYAVGT